MMETRCVVLYGVKLTAAALLAASPMVFAEDATTPSPQLPTAAAQSASLEEIIVTGSHIKRAAEAETAENIQVISAQEIQNSGQETVADYLRTISSNFGNSVNESFSNSFAPGAAMVGLRGLSGKDTLVLLDGRRVSSYALFQNLSDAFVDLNVIPLAAIERIEILKSGGSAIYGSDAIAGVINIILKKNTAEKAVELGGRVTTEGGAATRDANIRAGMGDLVSDGYNVFATASVYKRDQLRFSQRDNTASQDYTSLQDGINAWHIADQYATGTPSAFPTCGTNGLPGKVIPNGIYGPGCYYNDANGLALDPGTERVNLTVTGNLRLGDAWSVYGDLFYSNEETWNYNTPDTLNGGSIVVNPATGGANSVSNVLPANNPASLGGEPTPINYGFQSVGDRDIFVVSNTYRITAGLKGEWQGWAIDGGYVHSENHVSVDTDNGINAPNLSADIANGSFNFLNPALTPAANDALRIESGFASVAKLDTFDLKGSTGLFDLPGGAMSVAVGTELRHESVDDQPGAALASGLVLNSGVTTVIASRSIYAAFGEFDFPVLKSLGADLALREEHYSDAGSNLQPQVTVRWQPIREVTLRAVYAEGFRAPSLAEASTSVSLAHQVVNDPQDPQHRATEAVGYITGGNPLVKPETSKNGDLGIVFSPANHLDLSADFYDIFLYKVIAPNATAQQIINDPGAYPPGSLVRSANGTVVYAEALYTNQFEIHTCGVDLNANYSIPLAETATIKLTLNATHVSRFQVNQAGQWTDYAGSNGWDYLSPISGGGPVPHWKGTVSAGGETPAWAAMASVRYTSGYANALTWVGAATQKDVASFYAVDLNGEYRGLDHWKFTLSIVNLLNRQPPYDSGALLYFPSATPYDPVTYDDLGRMIDLHATYRF
jgi:iron complex outermembrane receptor protein